MENEGGSVQAEGVCVCLYCLSRRVSGLSF